MAGENETVREMWQEFRRDVLPGNLPPEQVIDMRRAFYAGGWAFFTRLKANAAADMPQEKYVEWLEKMEAEQLAFVQTIGTPLEGR